MNSDFLSPLLESKSMIICCGSGGVGKTTTAAVLALQGAMIGRKTLVLTIDPAKRLANSLGLDVLGNQIRKVETKFLIQAGLEVKGELHAMMLDCKRTFDEMVKRYAPSSEACQKILNNHYYQHLSGAMTGSHEYMAMEKLYEVHQENQYDLIVLDTPPTHNALDFLDAPNRVTNFLDDSVLKWFLKPYFLAGKVSLKTVGKGGKIFMKILERITGIEVLRDISEFFLAFSGMYSGFKDRAEKVKELLKQDETVFVLVTSPQDMTIEECIFFHQKLKESQMPFGGILVNKMHDDLGGISKLSEKEFFQKMHQNFPDISTELLDKVSQNIKDYQILFERDQLALNHLKETTQIEEEKIKTIRYFDEDIFALEDLKRMMEEIFLKNEIQHPSLQQTAFHF